MEHLARSSTRKRLLLSNRTICPIGQEGTSIRWRPDVYSCPYRLRTARHSLLTRALFAASVAPQRIKLVQFIPPARSHNRAAAGRHGANSFRSSALAAQDNDIRKTTHTISFIRHLPTWFRSGCEQQGVGEHNGPGSTPCRVIRSNLQRLPAVGSDGHWPRLRR